MFEETERHARSKSQITWDGLAWSRGVAPEVGGASALEGGLVREVAPGGLVSGVVRMGGGGPTLVTLHCH